MPFDYRQKDNGKWEVYNSDTGESKGESDSKDDAIKHMRALYSATSVEKRQPLSIKFRLGKIEGLEKLSYRLNLLNPGDKQPAPDLAFFANDVDVSAVTQLSQLFDVPMDSVGVSDYFKALTTFQGKVSVTIEPSSQKMRDYLVRNFRLNKVVTLAMHDAPGQENVEQTHSGVGKLQNTSLSREHYFLRREVDCLSKQLQVFDVALMDSNVDSSIVFTGLSYTPVSENKAAPISRERSKLLEKVLIPIIDDRSMPGIVIFAKFKQDGFDVVPIAMVLSRQLYKAESVLKSILDNEFNFGLGKHDYIVTQSSKVFDVYANMPKDEKEKAKKVDTTVPLDWPEQK